MPALFGAVGDGAEVLVAASAVGVSGARVGVRRAAALGEVMTVATPTGGLTAQQARHVVARTVIKRKQASMR